MSERNNSSHNSASNSGDGHTALIVPPFGGTPGFSLEMDKIREAEIRLVEAKTVSPVTYADLEHSFNEAYRDLKRHLSTIGYNITLADKAIEQAKASVILDKYPEFMKDKPKSHDNADMRKAVMIRDQEYSDALDRYNQLKAIESNLEGKIKVMENVCRYMRKRMDLLIRSGLSNSNLYITQDKK